MEQGDIPELLLASVDQTRRAFVRRLVIGSGFASPLVSSFTMGGSAQAQGLSPRPGGPLLGNIGGPARGNIGGPLSGNLITPIKSNIHGPKKGNIGSPLGGNLTSPITVPSPSPPPSPSPVPSPAPSPSPPPAPPPAPSPGSTPPSGPGPSGAVPEPATALLLGSGVALAGGAVLAQRVRARVRQMLEKWADDGDTTS